MENKIVIENPWYGILNSPEQKKRAKRRMKRDARAYRKKTAMWVIKVQCLVLMVALLAVVGIWYQLGA